MRNGLLALMGSGETSPTMVTPHREIAAGLGDGDESVILETPYAFQVNREDISAKAREYFRHSVGLGTSVLPDTGADASDHDLLRDRVRRASWVFSGPGSPSYALAGWRAWGLAGVLRERVRRGRGVTLLASAAACTAGLAAIPVYEIYKAGHAPHWLEGLDVLGALDVPVAVVPHYDNAEGGTHDTRFCYLGETRLAAMEEELPPGSAVLGIDEHTAVLVDLGSSEVRVRGRGVMTVRRHGSSVTVPAGSVLSLGELRGLVRGRKVAVAAVPAVTEVHAAEAEEPDAPLPEAVAAWEARFERSHADGDAAGMVAAVLGLEAVIVAWGADTEEDQGGEWARTVLRGLVRQLAAPLARGLAEPQRSLGLLLGPLVELRDRLRAERSFTLADELRVALASGGVAIRDTPEGGEWELLTDSSAS
ncbi:Type 1 glutamine amidotransferase-like domain-containing protein [Streptomyces sp. NPDC088923]|uniref:Type 1 glutamine amidotransferase-like domain-containing protein n=1 Tax=Streptomyces sp. NPDC088923 TaxID=3365913 RepID=UPI0037F6A70A